MIHGVEDVAVQRGHNVFLCNTRYDLERGMTFVRSLADKRVDGVLLMSSRMSDELVTALAGEGIPVVDLDWQLSRVEGTVSTIQVDFERGIGQAAAHLVRLGHRRTAHVSGPVDLPTARLWCDVFRNALASLGVDPNTVNVVDGSFTIEGGRRALASLLSLANPPTAIFAGNDLMALGLLWAARGLGIDVPKELSVIGLDDIELAAQVSPPLTSVALPRQRMGRLAMEMLLELTELPIQERDKPVAQRTVETGLIVRESTAPPAGQEERERDGRR